jgi:formylglycine-generating enzyme required for sulfatase activity
MGKKGENNMKRFIVCVAMILMAIFLVGNPASAKNTPNRLEITSATVVWADENNSARTIWIYGLNFGDDPEVWLEDSESPLEVTSYSDTQIIVSLPEDKQPGTYRLMVARQGFEPSHPEKADSLDITIGAVGPKGDMPEHEWDGTGLRFQNPDGGWPENFVDLKGDKGDTGDKGDKGPQGEQGSAGPAGQDGSSGADGKDGASGADGKDGVGITDALYEGGILTLYFSNNTSFSTGDLTGPQGPPGEPGAAGPAPFETITIPLADLPEGATPLELVYIPPGTFLMGSPESDAQHQEREQPQHYVRISQGFYIGKYEVTQAQWTAVMGTDDPSYFEGNNRPVEQVLWSDCVGFITKLNNMDLGLGTFRLPTEAEWAYACRAGTTTPYHWGDANINDYAWYKGNSGDQTHDVGQKLPNLWGLYDMSGNVYEWCQDWYSSTYPPGPQVDPIGPEPGPGLERVFRGCCWGCYVEDCRSADRCLGGPYGKRANIGFRVARDF